MGQTRPRLEERRAGTGCWSVRQGQACLQPRIRSTADTAWLPPNQPSAESTGVERVASAEDVAPDLGFDVPGLSKILSEEVCMLLPEAQGISRGSEIQLAKSLGLGCLGGQASTREGALRPVQHCVSV